MAYKHRDIVIAWMDGELIEIYNAHLKKWIPYETSVDESSGVPLFSIHSAYRIKPKSVMIRHFRSPAGCAVLMKGFSKFEDEYTKNHEYDPTFIFLDDWHEASFGPEEN